MRCIQSAAKNFLLCQTPRKQTCNCVAQVLKSLRCFFFVKLFLRLHCRVECKQESSTQYIPMLIQQGSKGARSRSCTSIECAVNQIQEVQRKIEKLSLVPGRWEIFARTPGDQCEIIGYRSCPTLHRGLCLRVTAEL